MAPSLSIPLLWRMRSIKRIPWLVHHQISVPGIVCRGSILHQLPWIPPITGISKHIALGETGCERRDGRESERPRQVESPSHLIVIQQSNWSPAILKLGFLKPRSEAADLTSLVSPLKEVNRIAGRLDVEMLISLTPPRGLWSWKSAYGCICIISLGEPVGLSSWLRRQSSGFLSNQASLC